MHTARQQSLWILLLILVSIGCGAETSVVVAPNADADPALPEEETTSSTDVSISDIAVVSVADLKTKVSDLQGNVVLLDLWATW